MKGTLLSILLLLILSHKLFSQGQHIKFSRLGIDAGLSQSNVTCILQDKRGFMWFGTQDGLNKYDGYVFRVYKNNPADVHSLSNNYIKTIIEDSKGNIWVGTWGGGLDKFNRDKDEFTSYTHQNGNSNSLSSNFISSLFEDSEGNLWIGTESGGVNRLNVKTGVFINYKNIAADPHSLSDNYVTSFYEDEQHHIWVGTFAGGLNLYNSATNNFIRFVNNKKNNASLSNNSVSCILSAPGNCLWVGTRGGGVNLLNPVTGIFSHYLYNAKQNSLPNNTVICMAAGENGTLWVGTENGGLSIFNPQLNTFTNFQQDDIDLNSLSNNSIYSIYKDAHDNMWVGTFSGGVNLYNKDANQFLHYKHNTTDNSVSNNSILYFFENNDGTVWIATDGGGLNLYDPKRDAFTHYKSQPGNKNTLSSNYVLCLQEDAEHNLWAGTVGEGITVINRQKNTISQIRHNPDDPYSVSGDNVCSLTMDKDKDVWVGTYGDGLNMYDHATGHFKHYVSDVNNINTLGSNRIESIYSDSRNMLWIATYEKGITQFNKSTQKFKRLVHDATNENSLSDDRINCIFEDHLGNIWIGTGGGLNCWNRSTGQIKSWLMGDGLPSNIVFSILEDNTGALWISTNKGLSKFDIAAKKFTNFLVSEGLQSNEFKPHCAIKSKSGAMYFGGVNGFNVFYPAAIKKDDFDPPLLFTNFQILNQDVAIEKDGKNPSPLKKHITETATLSVPYQHSVLSFEFASLNYTGREKKQYKYMLENFDKDWGPAGNRRIASYTNLDPGTYTLQVEGLRNDGQWSSKIATLQLIIVPPYWMTWWFRILLVAVVLGLIILYFRLRIHRINKQKAELERQVKERTEKLAVSNKEEQKARIEAEQANRAKSAFLAAMSHEIRTPMNGVMGMADLLAGTTLDEEQKHFVQTIITSGDSLLHVINDILDFSKIESGKMELEKMDFDLRTCVEEVLDLFAGKAAEANLDLLYEIDPAVPVQIIGDRLRLRQILMNLVGNALKFTQQGEVFVSVRQQTFVDGEITLAFSVQDTGIGIAQEDQDKLFKAFSQVDGSSTRRYSGTGLGLVICNKLVQLMGGNISVQSKLGHGSAFNFTIKTQPGRQTLITYVHSSFDGMEGKKVLIVDDNNTNLAILKNQLEQWKLLPLLASSGTEALTVLEKNASISLVITDMHMHSMDGVQLATRIKALKKGMPIMLLSSVGDDNYKKYPELFAAVLTKPVKQRVLYNHVFNELKQHKKQPEQKPNLAEKANALFADQYPLGILLAEDDTVNQFVAVTMLGRIGYHPEIAKNGVRALDLWEKNQHQLILMDMQMPELDGIGATITIRQKGGNQPVIIAMTANAMQGDKEKCLAAGMDDYITKPINQKELLATVQKWAIKIYSANAVQAEVDEQIVRANGLPPQV